MGEHEHTVEGGVYGDKDGAYGDGRELFVFEEDSGGEGEGVRFGDCDTGVQDAGEKIHRNEGLGGRVDKLFKTLLILLFA